MRQSAAMTPQAGDRRFRSGLRVIAGLGLLVRVGYVFLSCDTRFAGDGAFYNQISDSIAHGRGFISPADYLTLHISSPTAAHPPLWSLVLAVPARLGLTTLYEQQFFAALVGTVTVVVVGYAARAARGRVGRACARRRSRRSRRCSSCTSAS